jgi:hypothetical protein
LYNIIAEIYLYGDKWKLRESLPRSCQYVVQNFEGRTFASAVWPNEKEWCPSEVEHDVLPLEYAENFDCA